MGLTSMLPYLTDTVGYCYSYYLTVYLTYNLTVYNSIYTLKKDIKKI